MDAVKFIKERDRMFEVARQAPSLCYRHEKSAEEIVREVKEWSAAHPRKTRQSVFLEQWPDADIDANGVVAIPPCSFLKEYRQESKCPAPRITCDNCRREFWMQEVE